MDEQAARPAAEMLSILHASLARNAKAWGVLAARGEPVSLTAADAGTVADFFGRAAADTARIASLAGFTLLVVAPEALTEPQPAGGAKPALRAIDGGKP